MSSLSLGAPSPNPSWRPGDKSIPPFECTSPSCYVSLDPESMTPSQLYNLSISSIVPRPIALVTTKNIDSGVVNCAPFSYFGFVFFK